MLITSLVQLLLTYLKFFNKEVKEIRKMTTQAHITI